MAQVSAFNHLKQQDFSGNFRFYFKNKSRQIEQHELQALVRPKLKIGWCFKKYADIK